MGGGSNPDHFAGGGLVFVIDFQCGHGGNVGTSAERLSNARGALFGQLSGGRAIAKTNLPSEEVCIFWIEKE